MQTTVQQIKQLLATTNTKQLMQMDPLEQFDVLAVSLPLVGNVGFTNLSLLLAFNIMVMAS